MSSEVWYRKWRPQTFAEVVGQKHVTRTLARAVAIDRIAHAYVFCGPRGTGKTSTARILAKAANCEANEEGQPCTRCDSCVAVSEGRALDLIEMDAASNRSIDDIRSLRDKVGYSPNSSQYKVYLIDEAHELTPHAFDALLKTLEEPPPHVIFVLATTEAHKLPETILSRCQRFDFQRIKLADVVGRLRQIAGHEGVEASDATLEVIARRATGSLRDGVNQLEQAVATQGRTLTEESVRSGPGSVGDQRATALVELMLERRLADVLNLVADVRDDGADLRQFTGASMQYLRSVLLVRAGAGGSLMLSDEAIETLRRVAEAHPVSDVLRAARLLTSVDFRADPQSPLPLELALIEFSEGPAQAPVQIVAAVQNEQTVAGQPAKQQAAQRTGSTLSVGASSSPANPADRVRSALAPRTPPPSNLRSRVSAPRAAAAASNTNPIGVNGSSTAADQATEAAAAAVVAPAMALGGIDRPPGGNDAPIPAPAGALTLEQAQRQFRKLYERCKELDRNAAGILNSGGCDIVEIGDGTITFGFNYKKMAEMANGAAGESMLRRGVSELFGGDYSVRSLHLPEAPNRLQILAAEQPSHLLDEAIRLGAKPVER